MKALVFHGPGKRAWEDKPKPAIKAPTDAIVKIIETTICGTDLHIMKGVGIVEQVRANVSTFEGGRSRFDFVRLVVR